MYERVECIASPAQLTHLEVTLQGVLADGRRTLQHARTLRERATNFRDTGTAFTMEAADFDVEYASGCNKDGSHVEVRNLPMLNTLTITSWVKIVTQQSKPATLFNLGSSATPNFLMLTKSLELIINGEKGRRVAANYVEDAGPRG